MNYSLSPPNDGVGVLRARCRLVSSKGRDCLLPSKTVSAPCACLRRPQIYFSDKITLQLPFIRIFQGKTTPFLSKICANQSESVDDNLISAVKNCL